MLLITWRAEGMRASKSIPNCSWLKSGMVPPVSTQFAALMQVVGTSQANNKFTPCNAMKQRTCPSPWHQGVGASPPSKTPLNIRYPLSLMHTGFPSLFSHQKKQTNGLFLMTWRRLSTAEHNGIIHKPENKNQDMYYICFSNELSYLYA